MKVLLMVQTEWDKRPKFWTYWKGSEVNDTHLDYLARFKSWWLVECESAEAGRKCIMVGSAAPHMAGRILASGGKR